MELKTTGVPSTDEKNAKTVIRIVKALIEEQFDQEFDLAFLAEKVYLNPTYLSKLFKLETGMRMTDYLIEVRINKAKELVKRDWGLKLYEVASLVGYKDSGYFNKLFKKVVGVTLKDYRNSKT